MTFTIHGGSQGDLEKQGVYIPGTEKQLAAVHFDKGSWSITHVASGYAVAFTKNKARAIACGRLFWALLPQEARDLMRDNASLNENAGKNSRLAQLAGDAHRQIVRLKNHAGISRHNRIVDAYSNDALLKMAKQLEEERSLASA